MIATARVSTEVKDSSADYADERRWRGLTRRRRITFRCDSQPQELNVGGVAGTSGLLGLDEELFTADRDRHAVDGYDLDPSFGRACVVNAAGGLQQIDAILTT